MGMVKVMLVGVPVMRQKVKEGQKIMFHRKRIQSQSSQQTVVYQN
jgi:hypothetical protein